MHHCRHQILAMAPGRENDTGHMQRHQGQQCVGESLVQRLDPLQAPESIDGVPPAAKAGERDIGQQRNSMTVFPKAKSTTESICYRYPVAGSVRANVRNITPAAHHTLQRRFCAHMLLSWHDFACFLGNSFRFH